MDDRRPQASQKLDSSYSLHRASPSNQEFEEFELLDPSNTPILNRYITEESVLLT